MANGIARMLGSILPGPSLWQTVTMVHGNHVCAIARVQMAKADLLVSLVHGLLDRQC